MSTIVLPKQRIPATRLVPKIFFFYGMPKVGKTYMLSLLDDLLELDAEPIVSGAEMYSMMRLTVGSVADVINIGNALVAEKKKTGKNPYRFIAMDTAEGFEDYAIEWCTWDWNQKHTDPKEKVNLITDLEYGRGNGYVREKMKQWIKVLASCCDHLIIVGHVKDKLLTGKEEKSDTAGRSGEVNLSGKLGGIVMSVADAIGYAYRDLSENLRINFTTMEANPAMGSRFTYLSGKDIPFCWEAIFEPESEKGKEALSKALGKRQPVAAPVAAPKELPKAEPAATPSSSM